MQELISNLHKNNRRWVPILDAGIAQVDYFGYNVGKERNVFIQRNANDTEEFIG